MTKRLVLHIGDSKTGSSALQASLAAARAELAGQGICYDPIGPSGHQYLVLRAGRSLRRSEADLAQQNVEIDAFLARNAKFDWSKAGTVILSGESFLRTRPERLLSTLPSTLTEGAELHVIAYIGHPVDRYLSRQQQWLKLASTFAPPHVRPLGRVSDALRAWTEACAEPGMGAKLYVRPYDRAKLRGNSVVSDFAHLLAQISGSCDLSLPEQSQNESVSAEQLIALQRTNASDKKEGVLTPKRKARLYLFAGLNEHGLMGTRPELEASAKEVLFAMHKREIRALNALAPGLKFRIVRADRPFKTVVKAARDREWSGVETILERHDPVLLSHFEALLHAGPDPECEAAIQALGQLHPKGEAGVRRLVKLYRSRIRSGSAVQEAQA